MLFASSLAMIFVYNDVVCPILHFVHHQLLFTRRHLHCSPYSAWSTAHSSRGRRHNRFGHHGRRFAESLVELLFAFFFRVSGSVHGEKRIGFQHLSLVFLFFDHLQFLLCLCLFSLLILSSLLVFSFFHTSRKFLYIYIYTLW